MKAAETRVMISVVSPVYRAQAIVSELVRQMVEALAPLGLEYEIILVEDGSPDASWQAIEAAARQCNAVRGIKLSRNFGQHIAITAGLQVARGQYIIVMDCDLQDAPHYIPLLLQRAREGYDIVYTRKQERRHGWFKNITARLYFSIYNYLAETKSLGEQIGAYSLLSRRAVEAFLQIKDVHRHYLLLVQTLGFPHSTLDIEHQPRYEGNSSYTFSKLLRHALDGITSQSDKLLRLSIGLGFFLFIGSVLYALYLVAAYCIRGAAPGYTSLMAALLFSTGVILVSVGIAGIYIGKIFEQVKERPLYFVEKKTEDYI